MSATPRELHDTLRALLGAVRAESGGVR
jgi:hypothetical protein